MKRLEQANLAFMANDGDGHGMPIQYGRTIPPATAFLSPVFTRGNVTQKYHPLGDLQRDFVLALLMVLQVLLTATRRITRLLSGIGLTCCILSSCTCPAV